MKKYILLLAIIIMFLSAPLAFGAGSSVTETSRVNYGDISVLTLDWVSDDATGAVSATTGTAATAFITGKYIIMVETDPGATAPSDNYDITITDARGVDVMGGALANRD